MPILENPRDVSIHNSTLIDLQGDLIFTSKADLTDLKPYSLLRPQDFRDFAAECRAARLGGTCEWSTRHPMIHKWLHSDTTEARDEEPRIWLHGGPGTGKSVLAAYLVDKKKEIKSQDEIVLYAFCGVQGNTSQTSGSIALSFLRQCLEEYHENLEKHVFRGRLYRIMWHARDGRSYTMDQLRAPLFSILKSFKKISFIIDGVDECEPEVFERRGIIDTLYNDNPIPTRLLFLGRREAAVVKHLKDFPQVEIGGNETTQRDIQVIVNAEVDRLASEYQECRASKELLKDGLLRGAGNMFLWVKLKMDVIRCQLPCSPAMFKKVVEDLDTVPKGLTSLYDEFFLQKGSRWNQIHGRIAVRALQWLLYSRVPVREGLLGVAVAIDADSGKLLQDDVEISIKTTLNHVLGALVEWRTTDDGAPYATLVHHSLREYLLLNELPTQPPSKISPERVFKTCCAIMRSSTVRESFRQYYDSADKRRAAVRATMREYIGGRAQLQRVLCHEEEWGRWRERQLADLDEEKQWRVKEERRAQLELDELRDLAPPQFVEEQESYLKLLRKMRDDESEDARKLIMAPSSLERELMVYALKFLPHHLADTLSKQDSVADPIITSLETLIEDLKDRLSNIIDKLDLIGGLTFPRSNTDNTGTAVVDLPTTLKRLEGTSNVIQQLVRGELPKPHRPTFRFGFRRDSPATHPTDIWTDTAVQLFEGADLPMALIRTFEMATCIINDLRDTELALYTYEDRTAVVSGSSSLIHTLRHTGHIFALWVMAHTYMCGERRSEIVEALRNDSFLHPGILRTADLPTRIALPDAGVRLFDFDDGWKRHPIWFFLALVLPIIVGFYVLSPD